MSKLLGAFVTTVTAVSAALTRADARVEAGVLLTIALVGTEFATRPNVDGQPLREAASCIREANDLGKATTLNAAGWVLKGVYQVRDAARAIAGAGDQYRIVARELGEDPGPRRDVMGMAGGEAESQAQAINTTTMQASQAKAVAEPFGDACEELRQRTR